MNTKHETQKLDTNHIVTAILHAYGKRWKEIEDFCNIDCGAK